MFTSGTDLGVNVHQSKSNSEEHTAAALQEEDVPHSQAALQGQAVHKDAEEPVGADTGHVHSMPIQVTAQAGKAVIYQLLEHQLVNLSLESALTQAVPIVTE